MKLILTKLFALVLLFSLTVPHSLQAQKKKKKNKTEKKVEKEESPCHYYVEIAT